MATFSPGASFADNKVSTQKLNDLMDLAGVVGLTSAALVSGATFFGRGRPGAPVDGDSNITAAGLLEVYNGSSWSVDRTDPYTITLTNKSGTNMTAGDVVVADWTNNNAFRIAGGAAADRPSRVVGVLAADIADNAAGLVAVRGLVTLRAAGTAGDLLAGPVVNSVDANPVSDPSVSIFPGSSLFGLLLETRASVGLAQAMIWR